MSELSKSKEEAIRYWEIVVENQPLKEGEEKPFTLYSPEYFIQRYGSKDNYMNVSSIYHTYALLVDNEWYEKGKMGWFGINGVTKDSELAYIEKFKEIMNADENKDKWFIVVDCHI